MPKKRGKAEQIVVLLRQIEVLMSHTGEGGADGLLRRRHFAAELLSLVKGIRRAELNQARRIKNLERERMSASSVWSPISLEKQVLKDVASGNL